MCARLTKTQQSRRDSSPVIRVYADSRKSVRVGFNSQPSRSKNAACKKERTGVQFQIQYANQLYHLAENSGKEQDCVGHVAEKNQSYLNNIHLYQSCRFKLSTWKLSKNRTLHANKFTVGEKTKNKTLCINTKAQYYASSVILHESRVFFPELPR